jgi:hypothetical protein
VIRQIFLLVTSATLLLWGGKKCPDHYNPKWFEEPSDEIVLVIEEYFEDKKISFLPALAEIKKLGLSPIGHAVWQLPHSTQPYKDLHFPVTPGIWRYEQAAQNINTTHLLIKEHTRFSEIEAINVYNGLMGSYWDDYIVDGYEMTLKPEDTRIRYKDRYFELNVKLYGLKNDATGLNRTYTDIILRDYTHKVEQFKQCEEQK